MTRIGESAYCKRLEGLAIDHSKPEPRSLFSLNSLAPGPALNLIQVLLIAHRFDVETGPFELKKRYEKQVSGVTRVTVIRP